MMKVALIGAGNMGGALAHGWLKTGKVSLTIADKNDQTLSDFEKAYSGYKGGLVLTRDNKSAVRGADVIILVVKPWLMTAVIEEIKSAVNPQEQIIVSDAANFTTDQLAAAFGCEGQYMYAIPNIAAEYGSSMNFVARGEKTTDASVQRVMELYNLVGETMLVAENQVAAGMMMASCGIAYVMRMVRAMMQAGVEMGFYPKHAQTIAEQTMLGAVGVLRGSNLHPEVAIDKVTTPGGVTIKGINEMDMSGFTASVIRTLKAGLK